MEPTTATSSSTRRADLHAQEPRGSAAEATGGRSSEILARHRDVLFPVVTPYYADPIVMEEGQGVWVRDVDGREYLDAFGGILTTSLGHAHPRLVARLQKQVAKLGHTSTLYVTEPQVEAAERLAAIAPGGLRRSFFTNSGTEAIETAITLACLHTGRSEIIALRGAYHGRSTMTANLTAQAPWRPLASKVAGIVHTLAPYPYRCPFKRPCDESCSEAFARDLEEVILTTTNGRPAAFIAETIQGVGGYIVPPPGYFERAAEVIRRYGGLLIIDEVQSGFARTGGKWFGIEHWGVVPDIMVMAKGIAGGMPVGATLTTDEIAAAWKGKSISTFGGHPVSMAGMAETLAVMVDEDVPTRSAVRGRQLRAGMDALATRYDWIGEVRGMGLMQAMELVEDRTTQTPAPGKAKALLEACKEEGVLIGLGGLQGHAIRLGPSLLIEEDETAEVIERLGRACARVDATA